MEEIKEYGFKCMHEDKKFVICLPHNCTIRLCKDCFKDLALQVSEEVVKSSLR